MERALQKLARQIMGFDEASLSALYDKYAEAVQRFEPTRKWEEAVVMLGIIQTVRWKNQLFNHRWKAGSMPTREMGGQRMPESKNGHGPGSASKESGPGEGNGGDKRGKVLRFRPREDDEPL